MKIKKNIKTVLYFLLNQIFFFKSYSAKAAILMYHSIDINSLFFTVHPEDFAEQMVYLKKKRFNVISLIQLVELIERKQIIPKKTVVLTFDDGYEDNYLNAWPILKRYNFPATIFLVSGSVEKTLYSKQNITFKMLNWPQIQEMHKSGLIDFQPHSLKHQKLTQIKLEQAKNEIKQSKEIIEKQLNKSCYLFAYPRGDFNKEIIQILKENNFKSALTIGNSLIGIDSNLFNLFRKSINTETSMAQFKGKLKFNLKLFK